MTGKAIVVRIDLRRHTYLRSPQRCYFVFRTESGGHLVLEDRCVHRGAPLSRGERIPGGLRCPWHGLGYSEQQLGKLARPFVRRGSWGAVLLDEGAARRPVTLTGGEAPVNRPTCAEWPTSTSRAVTGAARC